MNTGWWQLSDVQRCDQRETVVACCTNLSVSVQIGLSVPTPEQDGHRLTWLSGQSGHPDIQDIHMSKRAQRDIEDIHKRQRFSCLISTCVHTKVKPYIILIQCSNIPISALKDPANSQKVSLKSLPLLCVQLFPNLNPGQLRFIQRRLCSLFLLTHHHPAVHVPQLPGLLVQQPH